eukprot:12203294-Alexandrium_andersonii.AAC.1
MARRRLHAPDRQPDSAPLSQKLASMRAFVLRRAEPEHRRRARMHAHVPACVCTRACMCACTRAYSTASAKS